MATIWIGAVLWMYWPEDGDVIAQDCAQSPKDARNRRRNLRLDSMRGKLVLYVGTNMARPKLKKKCPNGCKGTFGASELQVHLPACPKRLKNG